MPDMFKLQLSSLSPDTAQVRVVESPAGEPHQAMVLPFDPVTTRALLRVLEKTDLDKCQLDEKELDALRSLGLIRDGHLLGPKACNQTIGRRLFETLFPASEDRNQDVRGALEKTLILQPGGAVPFQLRFDSDAVDLARLPWELICDPTTGQHPVAAGLLRFSRYITFGQAIAPFPIADRLDVLVITARPAHTPYLPKDEPEAIRQAFDKLQTVHRVQVRHLKPPTRDALVKALNAGAYDVVHFDGHGALARRCPFCQQFQKADEAHCMNPDCPGFGKPLDDGELEGCLAFEQGLMDSTKVLVGARDLANMLTERQVRLFVASACQTGTVGGESVFVSVGPRLIQAGVPAVVAMQFSVPAEEAARFVAEFYASLARGESIAAAAAAGRRLLFAQDRWHIPAVYLRNRDGEGFLFRHRAWHYLPLPGDTPVDWASLRPPDAAPYKFLSPYEIIDRVVFHGREKDTDRVRQWVQDRRVAVLFGPPSVGKTSLVNAGLSPALIDRNYLVLTVQEVGDPVAMLRQEVAASPILEVDLRKADDLLTVVDALQKAADLPLVIVFDEFDGFLRSAPTDQQRAFAEQLAAYARQDYPRHSCVLLVLREDAVGRLQTFQTHLPNIFHVLVGLAPLTRQQAQQAAEEPLKTLDPPMAYDERFLRDTLLHDLCAEPEEDAINPAHLQIVCHELYQAAQRRGVLKIDGDLYPEEGTKEILRDYLAQSMSRLGPDRQDLAQALLKGMVSGPQERVFVAPARAAEGAHVRLPEAQAVLDVLLRDGLLETRVSEDGELTYSLSHHLLAEEVHGWFDREEALNHCAQQALDRAWADWCQQARAPREEGEPEPAPHRFLVSSDRLREIRGRQSHLVIGGPQICLLLHSAVHHRCDMTHWASELRKHAEATKLLELVQLGQVDGAPKPQRETASLCAEALGLSSDDLGQGALARAAAGDAEGSVRHTAALALGALGMDAIHAAQATLAGHGRRRVQVLAQIKAAGLPLPQLPLGLQAGVAAWATGLALWEARLQILAETLVAGLGAGLGLGLCLLLSVLLVIGQVEYIFRSLYLQPIGVVVGISAVAVAWLVSCSLRAQSGRVQVVGRMVGFWLGFLLGLVIFWLPLDLYAQLISTLPSGKDPFQTYVLGGSLWGWGIILGREAMAGFERRTALARALLGGGLGGAVGCVLAVLVGITVPLVEPSGALLVRAGEAILAGFGLGGGLAGGWELGARLWDWIQRR